MHYKTGTVYKGMWNMNSPHGEGQMLWHSRNEAYVGEWKHGRQHGKGVHAWFMEVQSGTSFQTLNKYDGEWIEGERHGRGVFQYADGARYEGQWEDNKKHGMGKHTFPDGFVYKGEFHRDNMVNYQKPKGPTPPAADVLITIDDLLVNQADPVGEVQRVKSILLQYMSELKQVFRYYSQNVEYGETNASYSSRTSSTAKRAVTPSNPIPSLIKLMPWQQKTTVDNAFAMSMIDFWKFAKDCRLPDAQLSLAEIDRIFLLVDKHSNERNDLETVHNPKRKIIYRGFLEGVVRLADYKYQDLLTTSHRLSHALFHNILPYACQESNDPFRSKLDDPKCAVIVSAFEGSMHELFKSICPEGKQTLTILQLLIYLEKRSLATASDQLNAQLIELYFLSMNGQPSLIDTNRTNMDSEMIFPEFIEVLLRYADSSSGVPDSKFADFLVKFFETLLPEKKVDWSNQGSSALSAIGKTPSRSGSTVVVKKAPVKT